MPESALTLAVDSFWISPYAFSCYVALKEKALPFEVRAVSLPDKDHHRPEYQQKSLTGRVPMLQHGDFALSESSAIVEYLDDAFPGTHRALPTSVRDRARARQIMAWVRSDLMPIREERPTTTMFGAPWSAADTDLAFMLQRLNLNGFELPPAVRRFAETQWQRPSVQEWVKRERLPYRSY